MASSCTSSPLSRQSLNPPIWCLNPVNRKKPRSWKTLMHVHKVSSKINHMKGSLFLAKIQFRLKVSSLISLCIKPSFPSLTQRHKSPEKLNCLGHQKKKFIYLYINQSTPLIICWKTNWKTKQPRNRLSWRSYGSNWLFQQIPSIFQQIPEVFSPSLACVLQLTVLHLATFQCCKNNATF